MTLRHRVFFASVALASFSVLVVCAGSSAAQIPSGELPLPSIGPVVQPAGAGPADAAHANSKPALPGILGAPPLGTNFSAFSFIDNSTTTGGWYFIPPDPIGAAGPFHVVNFAFSAGGGGYQGARRRHRRHRGCVRLAGAGRRPTVGDDPARRSERPANAQRRLA